MHSHPGPPSLIFIVNRMMVHPGIEAPDAAVPEALSMNEENEQLDEELEDELAEIVVEMLEVVDGWDEKAKKIGDYEINVAVLNLQMVLGAWMDERGRER